MTRWPALIIAGCLLVGGLWLLGWSLSDRQLEDPDGLQPIANGREKSASDPNAATDFVDSQKCRECHQDIFAAHAQHGHALTLTPTTESQITKQLAVRKVQDPQRNVVFEYGKSDRGELQVRSTAYSTPAWFPLQYAFGSGMHAGVTWVTIIAATTREPIAIEHRLSWVSQTQELKVTPGQEGRAMTQPVELFGHPHLTADMRRCFDCHSTHFTVEGTQITNLRANVGCQRCHGPGAEHVAAMERGDSTPHLRYPTTKSTAMDEVRLCGICHRLPEDLSPDEIVRTNRELPRMQSVALLQSRCFQESNALACSTCHDPHASAHLATRATYEQTCSACHTQPNQTHCPTGKSQGCVQCHMPPIEVNPGMPFHDHWIRVRTDKDPQPIADQASSARRVDD